MSFNKNMNNITFTGINNLKIGQAFLKNKGLCDKPQRVVKITCDLCDDYDGDDLSFYKTQSEKFGKNYKQHFASDKTPNKIEMNCTENIDPSILSMYYPSKLKLFRFYLAI